MNLIVHGFLAMTSAAVYAAVCTFLGMQITMLSLTMVFFLALIFQIYTELKGDKK